MDPQDVRVMNQLARGDRWFVTEPVREAAKAYLNELFDEKQKIAQLTHERNLALDTLKDKLLAHGKQVDDQTIAIKRLQADLASEIEARQVAQAQLEDANGRATNLLAELDEMKAEWNKKDEAQNRMEAHFADVTGKLDRIKGILGEH